MRVLYKPNSAAYTNDFKNQVGHGLPVFIGRGGLGNVLSGLFRSVIPIMKSGGKALLKEGVRTGLGVAQDMMEGSNFKTAAKRRATQAGQRMVNTAISKLSQPAPPGEPAIKKRRRAPARSQRRRTPARKQHQADIFG